MRYIQVSLTILDRTFGLSWDSERGWEGEWWQRGGNNCVFGFEIYTNAWRKPTK